MLIPLLEVLFWGSLAGLVYSYFIYPVLLSVLARLFGKLPLTDGSLRPQVAVVVPAYNEQSVIRQKIENLLGLDYPEDRLTIWIGSDCSTDATGDIVRAMHNPRVRLWTSQTRGGKTEVINKLAPTLSADVILFTDANTMHRTDSLKNMVQYYADPAVGGVGGHIEHTFRNREREEILYRSFESRQKVLESRLHSTISAFGGFYSVRREAFGPIPRNAYSNDDVLIPMNVVRRGYRMIFALEAVSEEDATENARHEFSRRVRIGAGNFQAFFWLLDFLNPLWGWPWFCYVSHKVTRWFSPLFIAAAMVSCCWLVAAHGPFVYRILLCAGLVGIAVSCTYTLMPLPFVKPLYYFISMNAALFLGLFRYLRGIRSAAWSHTERKEPIAPAS
jgi:cellulose synthase/poly-beta-1,6-N-acetylglucosamine synthase-like glycosyltransferase